MSFYVAPLEGITGYIFRNAFNEYFGEGVAKYYTPFIVPHIKRAFSSKELNEVLPDNNKGINLVPQILTNNADDFTRLKEELREFGYKEINLNLGCPSKTVTTKGRGAGALEDLKKLDDLLKGIYASGDDNISIKTRIGIVEPDEFKEIFKIYSQYPICELTIHPRVMEQVYSGETYKEVFYEAIANSDIPICYNGDIRSISDYEKLVAEAKANTGKDISNVMIGRGILYNPSLIRELSNGKVASIEEIQGMLHSIREGYMTVMSGDTHVLFKLKEIWGFLKYMFPDSQKDIKKLIKAKTISEYVLYENRIFAEINKNS